MAMAPDLDPVELTNEMWRITGVQTAKAYVKRLDAAKPMAMQIANAIAWSSVCMGEDAAVEAGEGDEAFVKHADCPWFHWHKRLDLLAEDRPGCDMWFNTLVSEVNKALGTKVQIETQSTLPDGCDCCLRRLWVD